MPKDAQGLVVTASSTAVSALDIAITEYYAWQGDPIARLREAIIDDPAFSLGSSAIAALLVLGGIPGHHVTVANALDTAEAAIGGSTSREKQHLHAAKALAAGSIVEATHIWESILTEFPCDALALRFAHDSYFYLGYSSQIRDSIARALPAWDQAGPNYGYVLGQYAFGLEETGEFRQAENMGYAALTRNSDDAWAIHAIAHVLEMEDRQTEGIDFLTASRADWSKAHALAIHNGWHLALYLIEQGRLDEVLADYDRYIAPKLANDALLDLVDASSLLWRLELAGADVGDRWEPLSTQWLTHIDDHVLVFNDLHIALAATRAGHIDGLQQLLDSLDAYVRNSRGDNREITAHVGHRLIEGVIAFANGEYESAIEHILPVSNKVILIGGSHAQRDLITKTLIVAATRTGQHQLVHALSAERKAIRKRFVNRASSRET